MIDSCPLCEHRVSNWEMAGGKTQVIKGHVVHKSCMIDYKSRYGKDYDGTNGHDASLGVIRFRQPEAS